MASELTKEIKDFTRQDIQAFLTQVSEKVVSSHGAYFHSILALNTLLRLPNACDIFDQDLKQQARDLWVKLKSTGLQLTDPPFLFGFPEARGDGQDLKRN